VKPLVLAIDPGPEQSAWVMLTKTGELFHFGIADNATVKQIVKERQAEHLAIEMIASYGMPVGDETFETCVEIGKYMEAWGGPCDRLTRVEVKMHLCHRTAKVTDAVIRRVLMDRFGGDRAVGKKKSPGPLYGVSNDVWAALGVAVTWYDQQQERAK
jgi:hypothetical protein